MNEKPNIVNTALCRGISSLTVIERFARGLRVPVWEMLYTADVAAIGCELDEWCEPLPDGCTLRFEDLMRERGLTQKELAERMGANRPNVNKWVHSNKLTLSTIEQFAKALEVEDRLYLLFITQAEYDAEMERRHRVAAGGDVTPAPEPSGTTGTDGDLFAGYPADMTPEEMYQMELMKIEEEERRERQQAATPQEVVMQEGVTYRCGHLRLRVVGGELQVSTDVG